MKRSMRAGGPSIVRQDMVKPRHDRHCFQLIFSPFWNDMHLILHLILRSHWLFSVFWLLSLPQARKARSRGCSFKPHSFGSTSTTAKPGKNSSARLTPLGLLDHLGSNSNIRRARCQKDPKRSESLSKKIQNLKRSYSSLFVAWVKKIFLKICTFPSIISWAVEALFYLVLALPIQTRTRIHEPFALCNCATARCDPDIHRWWHQRLTPAGPAISLFVTRLCSQRSPETRRKPASDKLQTVFSRKRGLFNAILLGVGTTSNSRLNSTGLLGAPNWNLDKGVIEQHCSNCFRKSRAVLWRLHRWITLSLRRGQTNGFAISVHCTFNAFSSGAKKIKKQTTSFGQIAFIYVYNNIYIYMYVHCNKS